MDEYKNIFLLFSSTVFSQASGKMEGKKKQTQVVVKLDDGGAGMNLTFRKRLYGRRTICKTEIYSFVSEQLVKGVVPKIGSGPP